MLALRASPSGDDRAIGEAYFHMFSPVGRDHRIEAEYVRDVGVVVTRGRHRVEAAQREGIDHVPVHLLAPDENTLNALVLNYEAKVARVSPGDVQTQRQLDSLHRTMSPNRMTNRLTSEKTVLDLFSARPCLIQPQKNRQRGNGGR